MYNLLLCLRKGTVAPEKVIHIFKTGRIQDPYFRYYKKKITFKFSPTRGCDMLGCVEPSTFIEHNSTTATTTIIETDVVKMSV